MTSADKVISELGDILRLAEEEGSDATIQALLAAVRNHLESDVAFVAEFAKGERVYRFVDAGADACVLQAGGSDPAEDTYCYGIAVGRLPTVIADARTDPRVRDLPVTAELDIGSYVGVPIRLSDGSLYGTLCAIRHGSGPPFTDRDARLVEMLARFIGDQFERDKLQTRSQADRVERIQTILRDRLVHMVFQPIVDMGTTEVVGYEALARFDVYPSLPPNVWFAEATDLGLGIELETLAIEVALAELRRVPPDVYLAVNASPAALRHPKVQSLVLRDPTRVVVEITEHDQVEAYQPLAETLRMLKAAGVRLAIDDAGTGYAGMTRILSLEPDLLKLDLSLTRGIDTDPVRQVLASGLISLAEMLNAKLIAEGIETQGEFDEMRRRGLHYGQGFFLGRPGPL